jgi:predicted extracellular nuclease
VDNPSSWTGEALRPYINQTVVFDVPMIVCGNANGNYTVSPWRKFQPESHGYIGTADYNATVRVNNNCMFSISGISGYHRCGEKIIGLKVKVNSTSSLTWQGGTWSGNTRADLEKGIPDLGDYRLLICGFNLENYYMTWGSMGASSYSEHQDQRAKISKALKQINADVYGLVELQQGDEAVAEIVSDLNKNLPGRQYKYFHDAATGTFQKVDYVYDANKVEPIGQPSKTDVEVQNRKKIVCFREIATGERFNYSINHFKAMNTGDEARRVNEARAVVELYNSYSGSKSVQDKDLLIMGDLNCYAYTAPIKLFMEKGLIDLHRAFHADSSYSYMFGGLASYIDHAITNETMYRQVTGMAGYHINSDEDDRYNYQKSSDQSMFRCSDHDPVLVGLKLDSTLVYDPSPSINSEEILEHNQHTMTIRNAYITESPSYYAIYTMHGNQVEMQAITSSFQEVQLPLTSGMYVLYIYFNGQVYQRKFIVP